MTPLRLACSLLASICVLGALGCGPVALGGSDLEAFAHEVDGVCVDSFHRGIEGEEEAEAAGEELGWSGPRIEAEIRYAWADALVEQYKSIAALGPPPEKAALMERWARTSLERSALYRRVGDAWLEGKPAKGGSPRYGPADREADGGPSCAAAPLPDLREADPG